MAHPGTARPWTRTGNADSHAEQRQQRDPPLIIGSSALQLTGRRPELNSKIFGRNTATQCGCPRCVVGPAVGRGARFRPIETSGRRCGLAGMAVSQVVALRGSGRLALLPPAACWAWLSNDVPAGRASPWRGCKEASPCRPESDMPTTVSYRCRLLGGRRDWRDHRNRSAQGLAHRGSAGSGLEQAGPASGAGDTCAG